VSADETWVASRLIPTELIHATKADIVPQAIRVVRLLFRPCNSPIKCLIGVACDSPRRVFRHLVSQKEGFPFLASETVHFCERQQRGR
jgi:hypothetical protein